MEAWGCDASNLYRMLCCLMLTLARDGGMQNHPGWLPSMVLSFRIILHAGREIK